MRQHLTTKQMWLTLYKHSARRLHYSRFLLTIYLYNIIYSYLKLTQTLYAIRPACANIMEMMGENRKRNTVQKLIIFDCDGVLVDSEAIHNKHTRQLLAEYGHEMTEEEGLSLFTGMSLYGVQQYMKDAFDVHIPTERWDEQLISETQLPTLEAELQPLMKSTLQLLHDRQIPRCVGSNGQLDMIHHKLRFTDQKQFFHDDHIFSADHVENPKPAPDLFLFAAKQMGFLPENCIVIEDSTTGIEAALAAKIPVIGFLGGAHTQNQKYIDKIKAYNIPMAFSAEDVLARIEEGFP
jgi:HAD superfamily hydrolase (TIGR01509 family)